MAEFYFHNYLDQIRINRGAENLLSYFDEIAESNILKLLNLLNDENLGFPTFFLLMPNIKKYNLYEKLTVRSKAAFDITKEMLTKKKGVLSFQYLFSDYLNIIHSLLRWIIETGYLDDGMNNDYDEVIDIASLVLSKTYRDRMILPYVADIIFSRYSKGHFIHHLVWAFFEAKAPESLILIANRLRSSNKKDIELAQKLLSFCPSIDCGRINNDSLYFDFIEWIEENGPFLYFKGENLQQTNTPKPYTVVLEGKYLHSQVLPETGNMLKQLTELEMNLLNEFIQLDLNTKIFLSDYSLKLYKKDRLSWNKWLFLPIIKQIKTAQGGEVL